MAAKYNNKVYDSPIYGVSALNYKDGDDFAFYIFPGDAYDNGEISLDETGNVELAVTNLYQNIWSKKLTLFIQCLRGIFVETYSIFIHSVSLLVGISNETAPSPDILSNVAEVNFYQPFKLDEGLTVTMAVERYEYGRLKGEKHLYLDNHFSGAICDF